MPARRRIIPPRAPAAGISGTRGAYDSCRTCGHARVKHLTSPPPGCAAVIQVIPPPPGYSGAGSWGPCECPAFTETRE